MGVIVNKKLENDEISEKIGADLRAKQVAEAKTRDPDFAEESEYLKETQKTGRFAWVWVVLIVLAVLALIVIFTPFS